MKNNSIFIFIFLILGISSLYVFIVKLPTLIPPKTPQTLKDLAYDRDKRLGYTVYIPENGKLEPYLVLTQNYYGQGNVLLIRKYLVEAAIPHNEAHVNSYYAASIQDRFMNELYIQEFPKVLQYQIAKTTINITD